MSKNKLPLYQAVQETDEPRRVIIGALAYHGLLQQYEKEKATYNTMEHKATMTVADLKKKIKQFKEGK